MTKKTWRPNTTRRELERVLSPDFDDFVYFVDTETEGLDPTEHTIIEIGIIKAKVEGGKFVAVDSLDLFINPGRPLDKKIIKITGITDEILADKPFEEDAFWDIKEFMGENPVFIAYNAVFDLEMVQALYDRNGFEFNPVGIIDVFAVAKDLISSFKLQSCKLQSVSQYLGLYSPDTKFHLAINDIEETVKILNALKDRYDTMDEWTCGSERARIIAVWHWDAKGMNHNLAATYVKTSCGTIAITDIGHMCKDKDSGTIDAIDMEMLCHDLADKYNVKLTGFDTFVHDLQKKVA